MVRYILLGLAFYLATKVVGGLFKPESENKATVKGEAKKQTLDFSEDDIVDVDFKEVKN